MSSPFLGSWHGRNVRILTSVHPIQNSPAQKNGENDFGGIDENRFQFHGCKDTIKWAKIQIYLRFFEREYLRAQLKDANKTWHTSTNSSFSILFCHKTLSVCANSCKFASSNNNRVTSLKIKKGIDYDSIIYDNTCRCSMCCWGLEGEQRHESGREITKESVKKA